MEFIVDYGLFLAKTATLLVALVALIGFIAATLMRQRSLSPEHIEVKPLNDRYRETSNVLRGAMLSKTAAKKLQKDSKTAKNMKTAKNTGKREF